MSDDFLTSWANKMGDALGISSDEPAPSAEEQPVFDGAAGNAGEPAAASSTDAGAPEEEGWWDQAKDAVTDVFSDDEEQAPSEPANETADHGSEGGSWWDEAKKAAGEAVEWATGGEEGGPSDESEDGDTTAQKPQAGEDGGDEEHGEEPPEAESEGEDDEGQTVIGSETGPYSLTANITCASEDPVTINLGRGKPAEPRVGRTANRNDAGDGQNLSPILFQNLPAGTYGLTVTQGKLQTGGAVTFPGAIAELHLDLRKEMSTLNITVEWAEDPDRGASVGVKVTETSTGEERTLSTDRSGAGSVQVTPGNYQVTAIFGAARDTASVTVAKGKNNHAHLTLSVGATLNISAKWHDSGDPVANAEINVKGPSKALDATTGSDGFASLAGVDPGQWTCQSVRINGTVHAASGGPVDLDAGELNTMYVSVRGTRSGKPECSTQTYSPGGVPKHQAAPDGEMVPTMADVIEPGILQLCNQVSVTACVTPNGEPPYTVTTNASIPRQTITEILLDRTNFLPGPAILAILQSLLTSAPTATVKSGETQSQSGERVKYTVIYMTSAGSPF